MNKLASVAIFVLLVVSVALSLGKLERLAVLLSLPTATEYPTAQPLALQPTLTPRPTYTPYLPYPTSTDWPAVYITETPVPTSTDTPVPTETETPIPTETPVPTDTETPTPEPTATIDPCPNGLQINITNGANWQCLAESRTFDLYVTHGCYGGHSGGRVRWDAGAQTYTKLSNNSNAGGYLNVGGNVFQMLTAGCSGVGRWTTVGTTMTRTGSGNNARMTIVSTP